MRRLPILLACMSLAVLSACGGDDDEQTASTPAPTATQAPAAGPVKAGGSSTDRGAKASVPQPSGSPPTALEKKDIVKGKGPAAKPGDTVSVQYVGNSW